MKVVGYCRYSSEGQRDGYSIEAQKRAINEFCQKENHTCLRFYVDEAQTGTDDDRENFLNMIDSAKASEYNAIIVHKLDRFARNRYDSAVYGKILEKHDIKLISVLEPMASDDSPEAFLFRGIIETYNEFYSKNLGREVLKGKKEAALQARHLGGPVPFGYMLDENNRYTPHPDEAPIVLECFSRLDSGQTPSDVARWLASKAILTRYKLIYTPHAVVLMTQNPVYTGRYTWGARSSKKTSQPIIIENAFPPIVSQDVYNRVYETTLNRRRGPMKRLKEIDYFLTGYLYCEHCGAHLYGFKSHTYYRKNDGELANEYIVRKYRCSNRKTSDKNRRFDPTFSHKPCELQMFKKEQLENFVANSIIENVFSEKTLSFVVKNLTDRMAAKIPSTDIDIKKTEAAIKTTSVKMERLLNLYLDGTMDKKTYSLKNEELTTQLELLNTELRSQKFTPITITVETLQKSLNVFMQSAPINRTEYLKLLLATFVDHIEISNEHIVIYYKLGMPGLPEFFLSDFVRKQSSVSTWWVLGNMSYADKSVIV